MDKNMFETAKKALDKAHEVKFDTSQLDGFPTVFGKNKDDKTPKMFKGDRTQDSLKKFLKVSKSVKNKLNFFCLSHPPAP